MMSNGKNTQPTTNDEYKRSQRKSKHWLEYAIFGFVIVTALATGYAAYYTKNQWVTMEDSEKRQLRAYVGVVPGSIHGEFWYS
jgi:hypothetical protein